MKRVIYIILISFIIQKYGTCQVGGSNQLKPFYSFYVYKKLNLRWSTDLYTLIAMKSMNHDYWLSQFNLGVNYKINKIYVFSIGYSQSLYKYGNIAWWERHYPNINPTSMSMARFHALNIQLKRNDRIGNKFKLYNKLIFQEYMPSLEKYKIRLQYNLKFSYRKSNLPIKLKPFFQAGIYYYLKGVPIDYYDQTLSNIIATSSPNGVHRYRIKLGTSLRPIKNFKKLKIVAYFSLNREFNLNGFGKDIDVPRPSKSGKQTFTSYPFNNYNILGLQINYFL